MTLVRTSLLNAIAVLIRLLCLLGINKLLALYVGPAGYAVVGQFQNISQMVQMFASGAVSTGVTKYTAEYYDNGNLREKVWKTASFISIVGSLVISTGLLFFSKYLSILIFKDEQLQFVLVWLSVGIPFFVANNLILSILNGRKDVQRYVLANISGSVFALVVTGFLSYKFKLHGALVALSIFQSISFFVTFFVCREADWFKFRFLIGRYDFPSLKKLGNYSLMALTTAIVTPLSFIFIRNTLNSEIGANAAGYWEAMSRLSSAYLLFITSTLAVYYLPRLSELSCEKAIQKEIFTGYKLVIPVSICITLAIYFCRDLIINLLFSADFLPTRDLFFWQLIGDNLKIGSWMLSYVVLGRAMTKIYLVGEVLFSLTLCLFTSHLVKTMGIEGATIAYALNYSCYWIFMAYVSRKYIFVKLG